MKSNKKIFSLIITFFVLTVFIIYFINNKNQFSVIADISLIQTLTILTGQIIIILANSLILVHIARLFKKKIPLIEAFQVTSYSAIINFFGFLQGGVGFRGYYLYKKFDISVKKYIAMTTLQYLFIFSISLLLILVGLAATGNIKFAITSLLFIIICLFVFFMISHKVSFLKNLRERFVSTLTESSKSTFTMVFFLSMLQLFGSGLAYFAALNAVGAEVNFGSLLIYTGLSQFSILIAITPGAIGVREALLLIAQKQMNLSTQNIVLAATIDRIVYFITLTLITPFALSARRYKNN